VFGAVPVGQRWDFLLGGHGIAVLFTLCSAISKVVLKDNDGQGARTGRNPSLLLNRRCGRTEVRPRNGDVSLVQPGSTMSARGGGQDRRITPPVQPDAALDVRARFRAPSGPLGPRSSR
jgi:hypothetical protein